MTPGTTLLGKYVVERVLGEGGMGTVLAARHVELGEVFAIKILLGELASDPEAVERFLREARAAVRLKGENAVKVVDVGRLEAGTPYMVMEHLEGRDLAQVLEAQGPLGARDAARWVMQACRAVGEAHGLGIVHRDLKPANLFLSGRPDGSSCVKVLDFGISKVVDARLVPRLTQTSHLIGTPYYMSPEQMSAPRSVDHRTDIWSLGIVLYELCTGRSPFDGETITELCGHVLRDDVVPPSAYATETSAAFDEVVLTCLAKLPEDRYQSAAELARALAPIAGLVADDDQGSHQLEQTRKMDSASLARSRPRPPTLRAWTELPARPRERRRRLVPALVLGGALVAGLVAAGWFSRVPAASPAAAPIAASPQIDAPSVAALPADPSPSASAPTSTSTSAPTSSAAPARRQLSGRPLPSAHASAAASGPAAAQAPPAETPKAPTPPTSVAAPKHEGIL